MALLLVFWTDKLTALLMDELMGCPNELLMEVQNETQQGPMTATMKVVEKVWTVVIQMDHLMVLTMACWMPL